MSAITRQEFREEERRIKQLRRQGWTDDKIKSWLRGWRMAGQILRRKEND